MPQYKKVFDIGTYTGNGGQYRVGIPTLRVQGPSAGAVAQSLRFRSGATTYLNRTPGSASNQKTWTQSFWVKRGQIGAQQEIYSPYYGGDGSNESQMYFNSSDQFVIYDSGASAGYMYYITTQTFKDTSIWYHFVIACDTTQATASNRLKIYVNGSQIKIGRAHV